MQKRGKIVGIVSLLCMLAAYAAIIYFWDIRNDDAEPEIFVEDGLLEVSVKDGRNRLLEGVSAFDKEDGDLTDQIIIDSVSPFNSAKERIVKYVVFDSENQVAEASRKIVYTDYTEPVITLLKAPIVNTLSNAKIGQLIGAVSSVDGDISNRVVVRSGAQDGYFFDVNVSVTDSTGTEAVQSFTCEYNRNIYMLDIRLKKYLVKIPAGTDYDFRENIKEIVSGNDLQSGLISSVNIQEQIDYETPGVYQVIYYLDAGNGNTGYTKCIVIVE